MIELIKRNRILFAAAGLLILLIVVLSLQQAGSRDTGVVDETVNAVTYPFQAGFANTANWISGVFDRYVLLVRLGEDNKRLKLENQALREELNHYINGSIQFDMLREQLKFKEADPERRIYSEVIGESLDNFHHTLLINKGHLAGIRRNFPVVLRAGVVGRIHSVTALQSVVQLIVDRRHRFPVVIQRTRERLILEGGGGSLRLKAPDRGIVKGQGSGLHMERIRMLADVEKGDRVITSGLAGIFPRGLLVGVVTEVSRERHELFQKATIRPVVDFNKIEGVYVIMVDRNEAGQPFFSQP